ncbi:hypothetical protein PF001_g3762 [Phytophthora fragariae]|uniref:HAT C-terminal dimerisation domain-containing protein n=1 Tax=Phytophthora fragariae TaxID=53985 RepID=A0A6A4ECV3_9STRA|nr:hypothetical protein PF006_g4296 [Phytophthora fragariae]KAE9323774.1 hypothetical protein PF001_g3762 [Phytophthora fragariae]
MMLSSSLSLSLPPAPAIATTRGSSVQEFIANWHGSGEEEATTVDLVKYLGGQCSTSFEAKLIRQKQLTVAQYWVALSQFPLLKDIVFTVFVSACSRAVAERNWSAHNDDLAFYDMTEDLEANSSDEEDNNEDSEYEYY